MGGAIQGGAVEDQRKTKVVGKQKQKRTHHFNQSS